MKENAMRKLIGTTLIAACCLVVPLLATSPARAGLEACGDIHVEANAQCKVEVSGGCVAKCTPISFYAACSAEGYATCEGDCDLPSVECDASCEGSCQAECDTNENFSCEGNCTGSCDADCSGQCSAAGNKGECEAQCKATCKGECEGSCNGAPVECDGQCKGSCEGSCKAKTNMSCQVECQGELSASCQSKLEGGCKVACESPEGALFCNGQYVDHGGNMKDCIAALNAMLTVKVDASATGSIECSGGSCEAEGEAEAGCSMSVANQPSDGSTPYAIGLLGALGALVFGRSRRRQK